MNRNIIAMGPKSLILPLLCPVTVDKMSQHDMKQKGYYLEVIH
jgi:hypothetical protein